MIKPAKCAHCSGYTGLCLGRNVYPGLPDIAGRFFWKCFNCGAFVGTHKNSKNYEPLGTAALPHLRKLRVQVHIELDKKWVSREGRSAVYKKLARRLKIKPKDCHIGMFNEEMCLKALEILGENNEK